MTALVSVNLTNWRNATGLDRARVVRMARKLGYEWPSITGAYSHEYYPSVTHINLNGLKARISCGCSHHQPSITFQQFLDTGK